MRILRGKCMSASSSSNIHRVKVSVEGVCDNMLMDVSNGIYLRNGDEVFVLFEDDFNSPLVVGRCSGQLELQDVVDILNNMVDVFNKHQHTENAALKIFFTAYDSIVVPTELAQVLTAIEAMIAAGKAAAVSFRANDKTTTSTTQQNKVKPDDFLY